MISRHWKGIAKPGHAEAYIHHLETDTFPQLATLPGFIRASILERSLDVGTEFKIVTVWESIDAVRAFAGDDLEVAVVPAVVQTLMISYDSRAVHYELAATFEPTGWWCHDAATMSRPHMTDTPRVDVILKRFESPDEVREMLKGRFELVHIGGLTIGRATYEPGWRWSEHVGPGVGATRCTTEHVGLVLQGRATAAFDDGHVVELREGELFYIPPTPHDSWVVGATRYVSLHFLGAEHYAAPSAS